MNVAIIVVISCAVTGFFLFFQYILPHTYLLPIFSLLNNFQLILSNYPDQEIIQKINAEDGTEGSNNINQIGSINRAAKGSNVVGLWTPMNASFVLQHLKGEQQEIILIIWNIQDLQRNLRIKARM